MAYSKLKTFADVLDSFLASAPLQLSWLRDAAIDFVDHLFVTGFRYQLIRVAGGDELFLIIDEALRVQILGSEIVVEHGFDGNGKLAFEPNVPLGCWSCTVSQFVAPSYGK